MASTKLCATAVMVTDGGEDVAAAAVVAFSSLRVCHLILEPDLKEPHSFTVSSTCRRDD